MCHGNFQRKGGHAHAARTFYLSDSSGQVLDKKPPQVVECLQLPGLCDDKETQLTENKEFCPGFEIYSSEVSANQPNTLTVNRIPFIALTDPSK